MTTHRRSRVRRAAAVAATATAALVLAACGGGDDSGHSGHGGSSDASESDSAAPQEDEHNAADIAFAQGMIPHHRQAVEMARLAGTRAASPEVVDLAERIEAAQDPEIETLTEWLTGWGEEVPADSGEMDDGMDHSGHDMSGSSGAGMMTSEDMTALENATGEAFDTAFLELMVEHHLGAVEMAETEQAEGAYPAATDLAAAIISAQSDEIDEMNQLLEQG